MYKKTTKLLLENGVDCPNCYAPLYNDTCLCAQAATGDNPGHTRTLAHCTTPRQQFPGITQATQFVAQESKVLKIEIKVITHVEYKKKRNLHRKNIQLGNESDVKSTHIQFYSCNFLTFLNFLRINPREFVSII